MEKRDSNIEVFRALLMLGICTLHSITLCGHPNKYLSGPLCACVNGFVFISGYYGVKFSVKKIQKLYALGVYCVCAGVVASYFVFGSQWLYCGLIEYCVKTFKHHWFLHAYVVMMSMAPMVDYIIDSAKERGNLKLALKPLLPVLLLVFGWGGLTAMPYLNRVIPVSSGVTSYSGLTLFGVYIVARLYRVFEIEKKLKFRYLLVALPCLLIIAGPCGFYDYSTPTAVILAMIAFSAFKKIHIDIHLGWLTPSLFAVYFYHTFPHGNIWVKSALDMFVGWGVPIILAYALTGLSVFIGCIIFDIPRRFLFRILRI